jgi:biotin operon repressor
MKTGGRRRDQIADYIEQYAAEHGGNSPSLQEIADALKISKATVVEHVQKLIDEGRAMRRDGKLWLTQPLLFPLPGEHDKA